MQTAKTVETGEGACLNKLDRTAAQIQRIQIGQRIERRIHQATDWIIVEEQLAQFLAVLQRVAWHDVEFVV